jgi:hypothetical protein
MITRRMPWLLSMVVALLLLRWLAPLQPAAQRSVETVQPVEAPIKATPNDQRTDHGKLPDDRMASDQSPMDPSSAVEIAADQVIGNAFSARPPPTPLVAPPPVQAPIAVQPVTVAVPPPPPPKPPPLTVIGTWDDGVAPGVFISTPQHTVLARKDTVLMSDYRVISIAAGSVSLLQVSTQLPWRLSIPQNAPPAHSPPAAAIKRPTLVTP